MDSKHCSSIICIGFITIMFCLVDSQPDKIFNVSDYGAISKVNLTDNQKFFTYAWKKACATKNGVVLIPPGTYYLSEATFRGPCNGKTTVTVNGLVKAFQQVPANSDSWIKFTDVDGLTVDGFGTLDGNGASHFSQTPNSSLSLVKVFNSEISNIKLVDSNVRINESRRGRMNNLTIIIISRGHGPQTNGVHIARSANISVLNSAIATGGDCVSIEDGSSDVEITEVSCSGPGHGFSIGSLGEYSGEQDVSKINVTNCKLTNTENGVWIKTTGKNSPSNSTVHDVTFQHIVMNNVNHPIVIDQHYCPNHNNCSNVESAVQLKNVKFIDVRGSSNGAVAVKIDCSGSKPCQDIEMSGLNIKYKGQPTIASCSKVGAYKFIGSNQIPSKCS